MKLDEVMTVERGLAELNMYISMMGEDCSRIFPRNAEITGRINDLKCCYKRLEETLILECYKEAKK